MSAGDLPQDLEPVLARHLDVEQDEVGPFLDDRLNSRGSVRGLSDDVEIGLVRQHRPEPSAGERLVVDDQRTHSGRAGFHGAVVR